MSELSYRQTIRFTEKNVRYIESRALGGEDFSSTLRRIIHEHQELSKADLKLDQLLLEVTMKTRLDKLTDLAGVLVESIDKLTDQTCKSSQLIVDIAESLEPKTKGRS
jgi:hypothetical protein